MIYIVIFEHKVRGVYTCGTDANPRVKQLDGGEIVQCCLNQDVDLKKCG